MNEKKVRIISVITCIILLLNQPVYVNAARGPDESHRNFLPLLDFRASCDKTEDLYLEDVEERLVSLATREELFPVGEYWNHHGQGSLEEWHENYGNGYVEDWNWTQVTLEPCATYEGPIYTTPAPHNETVFDHDYHVYREDCNSFWDGEHNLRDEGFAKMICEMVFGEGSRVVDNNYWVDSSVNNLCIGDYVRDTVGEQSFVVYKIENGLVTAYECNYGSENDSSKRCLITNDRTISIDTLRWMENNGRLYIRHCRHNLNQPRPLTAAQYWDTANSTDNLSYSDVMSRINTIKQDYFIPGKYWNHYGMSSGEYDCYTVTDHPCGVDDKTIHDNADLSTIRSDYPCNFYTSASQSSTQCMGFARLVCKGIFGTDVTDENDWIAGSINNLYVGDYVRIPGHSMVVIGTNGSTINVLDCNWGAECIIRERSVDLGDLRDASVLHCVRNQPSQQITPSNDSSNNGSGASSGSTSGTGSFLPTYVDPNTTSNHEPTPEERGYIYTTFTIENSIQNQYEFKMESQGAQYREVVNRFMPEGFSELQSVNILTLGVTDRCLKEGTVCLRIPEMYKKTGRCFAIFAVDKNGIPYLFMDKDSDENTITVDMKYEGFAFSIIYTDDPMLYYNTHSLPFIYFPS